ncbi:MAG: hypothetical protein ACRDAX_07345 [Propionibacteriaceae bacterium]
MRDSVAEFSEIWKRGNWDEFSSFVAPENLVVVKRTFIAIHSLPHVETNLVLAVDNQPLVSVKDGEKFDIDGFIRHRVIGVDKAPLLSPASYSFSKDSSGAVKLVGFSSRRGEWVAPWDLGEIATVASDHVMIMCPIEEEDFIKGLIDGYEKKFLELKSELEGLGIPERVVVYQGRNAISESVFAQSRYPNSDESKYYRGMFLRFRLLIKVMMLRV